MLTERLLPGPLAQEGTCPTCGSNRHSVQVGFEEALKGREDDFPTLARAFSARRDALAPKVEWQRKDGTVAENHCQIFRTPFDASTVTEEEALLWHLRTIEQALLFGKPGFTDMGMPRFCGGVYHYLGRLPREGDTVSLRVLRDLMFLPNRQAMDADRVDHEYLSELSLVAIAG